ncbi:DUF4097 domain-containing protein [Prauserella oleivorans]|uniref:DUF4097 domain-containing protein n=1 Tax=Prauserella oleivorans TaxID=1478153 RepID=A0ABW5W5Q6_9PSEU
MTEQPQGTPEELVRSQTFDATGPLELNVDITVGRVEVKLGEGPVLAEIRHDPAAQAPWSEGVSSLLSWVGERFGSQLGTDLTGSPADAVAQCRIEQVGTRLTVAGPKPLPLRNIPLAVTLHAPEGSHLTVRAGSAEVGLTGSAGRVDVATGSGSVSVETADGAATLRTGSGGIKAGALRAGLQLRSGSGDVDIAELPASGTVASGSGAVRLGEVSGSVLVRTSSGDVSVAGAAAGSLEAITGSGNVRIGIRHGVAAEIELSSGSGRVSSELDVAETPPDREVPLSVRARTGSGDAVVTRAAG